MGRTSNEAKCRFNDAHYVQIKVSVKPDVAAVFKERCKKSGVSMASELSRFMSGNPAIKNAADPYSTRLRRRKALTAIVAQLQAIADAENSYLENIPTNLQNGSSYQSAELTVSALHDALDILIEAY
jgi:hypothetical protein